MERLNLEFYYGQEAEQFTFYRLPKALITDARFKDISNNAKLLYGLMLDRMSLSARSGWFDEGNRVYIKYAIKSIMEDLNCSKMTAVGALKELHEIGLIDMVQENGKANIIYVKNFVSQEKSKPLDRSKNQTGRESVPVEHDQSKKETGIESRQVQNEDEDNLQTSTCPEFGPAPVKKLDPNNNEFNNNNLSNGCKAKLSFQRGNRLIDSVYEETWNIFAEETVIVIPFSSWDTTTSGTAFF